MKTKINSKSSTILITLICVTLSVGIVGTAHAATKAKIDTQTKASIDPAVAKQNFKDMLEIRIAQYKAFIANMPSSLSASDQQALTTDMNTSISNMQNILSNTNNASTSPRLSESDMLIAFKISLLTQIFHTNPIRRAVATSTKILVKAKVNKSTNVSTSTQPIKLSVQQIKENLLTNFALGATTTISSDLVEQVINTTSTKVLGDLSRQVNQEIIKSRITPPATTSKSSFLSKLKAFFHL